MKSFPPQKLRQDKIEARREGKKSEKERKGMYSFVFEGHSTKIHLQRESIAFKARLRIAIGCSSPYFLLQLQAVNGH